MEVRVGCDLVAVSQVEDSMRTFGERYLRRVYNTGEIADAAGSADSLAARFAAKEAVVKILRLDDTPYAWTDVEVLRRPWGGVGVALHGPLKTAGDNIGITTVDLSISHDGGFAMAVATAVLTAPHTDAPQRAIGKGQR